jgi:hypothetical protein
MLEEEEHYADQLKEYLFYAEALRLVLLHIMANQSVNQPTNESYLVKGFQNPVPLVR